jgi:hypothetical protein
MKDRYVIIIGLVVILLASGVYFFYTKKVIGPASPQALEEAHHSHSGSSQALQALEEAHHSGDVEKSIQLAERALSSTASTDGKNKEAHLKLVLASDYLRVQPDRGIDLLKSVAADTSYGTRYRATAISYIADAYMNGSHSPSVALDMIFVGEPYGSFLEKDSKGKPNIPLAVRRLYEYSTQLYSFPQAEYRIAEWYAKLALAARLNPSVRLTQPESEYIANIKTHLAKGDAALADFIAEREEDSQIGYAYWLKGMLLGNLAELTNDKTYLVQAEEAFRRSMELLRNPSSGIHEQSQSVWAAFHFAVFLSRNYGNERANDIKDLLVYLSDPKFDNFASRRYFARLAGSTEEFDTYDRENVLTLAKFSADFQALLKKLGWAL